MCVLRVLFKTVTVSEMITVDIAEAHSRFDELIHRSQRGESFIVLEKEKPIATLGPVAQSGTPEVTKDYLAEARALRAMQKLDLTPIKDDIEFGRL